MAGTGFNRVLSLLRKEAGITQKEAAKNLGISQALLSHYERGIRECGLEFLVKVADYYGVSCDYLLGRSPDRSGLMLKVEDIPLPDDKGDARYRGSVLPTLNKKLISNSLNILFDLLQEISSKSLTTNISNYLMLSVYKMYRGVYCLNKDNPSDSFSIPDKVHSRYSDAEMSIIEAKIGVEIEEKREKKTVNSITPKNMEEKYPLYYSSLANLILICEKMIKRKNG
ncbi:MAG: helix-turn-helix transcriptional regulator [Ruminococcaceae bacterium]|nr:helix-turn-helix transcriptional regulator [Oscillospiraceae bacterium]